MKRFGLALCFLGYLGCAAQQPAVDATPRMRQVYNDAAYYHRALEMRVGWFPYSEEKLVAVGENEWMLAAEKGKKGFAPAIIVSYPDTTVSISLNLDMDNELLGKLVKHSLMTQKPISWPLKEYLIEANCAQCHPAHIELPEEN